MSYVNKCVQKGTQVRVYEVIYQYEDFELGRKEVQKYYYPSLEDVMHFFTDLLAEREMLDTSQYKCRENTKITIRGTFISEKFYNNLFH